MAIPPSEWMSRPETQRLAVLRGFAPPDAGEMLTFCRQLGDMLEWEFGAVNELQARPDARNYLYTNREVPFHWDGAFAGRVPHFIFFHCRTAPPAGSGLQHGPHVLTSVLRFGSGPEQAVKFTGSGERHISTMIMLAPNGTAPMDSARVEVLHHEPSLASGAAMTQIASGNNSCSLRERWMRKRPPSDYSNVMLPATTTSPRHCVPRPRANSDWICDQPSAPR